MSQRRSRLALGYASAVTAKKGRCPISVSRKVARIENGQKHPISRAAQVFRSDTRRGKTLFFVPIPNWVRRLSFMRGSASLRIPTVESYHVGTTSAYKPKLDQDYLVFT
jgi:hypothetical protein